MLRQGVGMSSDVRQFSSDKILKHVDRVDSWLKGDNPPPITTELDMTNDCNHRCPECTGWSGRDKKHHVLSWELVKSIIKQLSDIGVRGLIFTGGGEPLCSPNIKKAVELAASLGLDMGFITNGTLIEPAIAKTLLCCCAWVRISLDAATPTMFKKTHGLGQKEFDRVLENARLLTSMKKSLKSKTTIGIGYLTASYTNNEMYQAAVLSKSLGVDYLQYRPMFMQANKNTGYSVEEIDSKLVPCLAESTKSYQVLYSKHKYDMMKEKNMGRYYKKCYGQQFSTVIAADGCIYVCCHMRGNKKYCIGNLNKNTFTEIWNSDKRQEVIKKINFKDCIPLCRDNTFNQVLWNIKQPTEHVNFL